MSRLVPKSPAPPASLTFVPEYCMAVKTVTNAVLMGSLWSSMLQWNQARLESNETKTSLDGPITDYLCYLWLIEGFIYHSVPGLANGENVLLVVGCLFCWLWLVPLMVLTTKLYNELSYQ